jgi:hypothetical protein
MNLFYTSTAIDAVGTDFVPPSTGTTVTYSGNTLTLHVPGGHQSGQGRARQANQLPQGVLLLLK